MVFIFMLYSKLQSVSVVSRVYSGRLSFAVGERYYCCVYYLSAISFHVPGTYIRRRLIPYYDSGPLHKHQIYIRPIFHTKCGSAEWNGSENDATKWTGEMHRHTTLYRAWPPGCTGISLCRPLGNAGRVPSALE